MSDVFISYSEQDSSLAEWLYQSCRNFKIDTFLASISLQPGHQWKQEILNNLRISKWFFFLATPNSIQSDAVMLEIGGALTMNKNIIPILYGLDFRDLPEWIRDYQGINIRNNDISELTRALEGVAGNIKADKIKIGLIIGAFIGALLLGEK